MNSTSTRFRVQTAAPLELIKAWHAISTESDIRLIDDLRNELIQTLELTEVDGELVLELDGFSLLPSSPVGVVRDGDMITVRCKPRIEKRKATEAVDQTTKKRKTQSPTSSPTLTPPAPPMAMLSKSPAGPSSIAGTTKPVDSPTKPPQSSSEDDSSTDSDSSSDDSDSSSDDS
ncbi:unnamed protein product [Rhizoctonia solani]|uniref:Coilin n=1 Tax=Rhizoctonia solani TaxID=456999 RepID=A0A8H3I1J5_9AGAM|nr:unnamed protein product [Rhizoctonia solani]